MINPVRTILLFIKINAAGKYGEYYLYYFGSDAPREWAFVLPDDELKKGMKFKVDIIDTWDMTIKTVPETFEIDSLSKYNIADKKKTVIKLPGKPYIALRIRLVDPAAKSSHAVTVQGREPAVTNDLRNRTRDR